MNKGIIVLSLFDGMSCGQLAIWDCENQTEIRIENSSIKIEN